MTLARDLEFERHMIEQKKSDAIHKAQDNGVVRTFETGATRTSEVGKHDFEGFLSPLALERFAEYMTKHRTQADGTIRPSDNWQKGIPLDSYMKSMWRHFFEVWAIHRGYPGDNTVEEALAALFFNVQGYLHEIVKKRAAP